MHRAPYLEYLELYKHAWTLIRTINMQIVYIEKYYVSIIVKNLINLWTLLRLTRLTR